MWKHTYNINTKTIKCVWLLLWLWMMGWVRWDDVFFVDRDRHVNRLTRTTDTFFHVYASHWEKRSEKDRSIGCLDPPNKNWKRFALFYFIGLFGGATLVEDLLYLVDPTHTHTPREWYPYCYSYYGYSLSWSPWQEEYQRLSCQHLGICNNTITTTTTTTTINAILLSHHCQNPLAHPKSKKEWPLNWMVNHTKSFRLV